MQESINQENFELLKEYYTVFMEKMPPDCKYASYQKKKTHNNNNFLINNSLGEERSMEEKSMGWECESDFEIVCAKETDCKGGLADTCLVILIAFKCVLLLILGH